MSVEHLYLLTGEDVFERERALQKIKDEFGELVKGINYVTIEKETIYQLSNEVTTFPFGYPQKLIVVSLSNKPSNSEENTNSKNDWFNDSLAEEMKQSLDVNVIVFVGELRTTSRLYKWISQNGKVVECQKPKSKKDLAPWVVALFRQYGKVISLENANAMVQICGSDKLMLNQEVQKLVDYAWEKDEITKEAIEQVGMRTAETIIFDLTDAVGNRNLSVALRYLEELIQQKEPIQKIIIMIAKQFQSLWVTKICQLEKRDVGTELNLKFPFMIHKYQEQARKFEKKEIEDIIIRLASLDVDSKVGKIEPRIGLEMCLLQTI